MSTATIWQPHTAARTDRAKLAEVQHRYVGDVGDFLTYGLLRVLSDAGIGRLGVIWYLVADETHNADGRHVTYLAPGNRIGQQLRDCDPSLFDRDADNRRLGAPPRRVRRTLSSSPREHTLLFGAAAACNT